MALDINPKVYSDLAERLQTIEKELRAQPITWELRQQIVQELDEVHQGLSQLETTAVRVNQFAQSFLAQLRQQAIFLYGEVDDFFYKHEIEVIQDETHLLAESLEDKNRLRIAQVTDALKAHINELLDSYSPLLKDRRVLVFAKLMLEQAEGLLNGQQPAPVSLDEWSYLEAEEIIEEIAEYLGHNDRRSIRLLWKRLTSTQRQLVLAYLNPKDMVACLLHNIEGSAHDCSFSG